MCKRLINGVIEVTTRKRSEAGKDEWRTFILKEYNNQFQFEKAFLQCFPDEKRPEMIIRSKKSFPHCLSEYINHFDIIGLIQRSKSLGKEHQEALFHFCYLKPIYNDSQQVINDFQECYIGFFDSEEDFAYSHIVEEGIPQYLEDCIDYSKAARKILFNGKYQFCEGFVFKNKTDINEETYGK